MEIPQIDWQLLKARLATFDFAEPVWLWGLLLLLILPFLYSGRTRPAAIRHSTVSLMYLGTREPRLGLGGFRLPVRAVVLALLIIALAQPRLEEGEEFDEKEGIDIMLVLDYSMSMDQEDFFFEGEAISRLEALNKAVGDFIENRERDRIGVIGFARDPYLISPLTSDHDFVTEMMGEVETKGGTAIGSAMVAAVDTLKKSETETKILVVVSDGLSNTGVPPMAAARLAAEEDMRVYPIEILDYRKLRPERVLDHPLHQIAKLTGGQFYQAADYESLENIYQQIDELETSLIKEKAFKLYTQLFPWFLGAGLALILIEALSTAFFRKVSP